MPESLGEKTEQATPRKLEISRRQGQVPKSQDLTAGVALVVGTLVMLLYGGAVMERFALMLRAVFENEIAGSPYYSGDAGDSFRAAMTTVVLTVLPVMIVAFLASYVSQFIQVGWLFTLKPVQPKFEKLNPQKGIKRIFEPKNAVKTLVSIVKLTVAIGLTWALMAGRLGRLASLPAMPLRAAAWMVGVTIFEVAALLSVLLLIIGILDWFYQKWQYKRDQRMTKQEVKDERRSMEGDVEVKRQRHRMYQEIIRNQIRGATPEADVIVTNPTHFSVAIKYDDETMAAPTVTAKGADLLAFQIRQIAEKHGVPIVERPPLARALYHGTEVGQQIAPEHYAAVAELLAYVYRLDQGQRARRGERAGKEGVGAA
jgi:flagellar biosynthetic protein FlhB